MGDTDDFSLPDMRLAQAFFVASGGGARGDATAALALLKAEVLDAKRSGFYAQFRAALGWAEDEATVAAWKAAEAARMSELEAAIAHAKEHEGESEVRAGYLSRADYLCERGLFGRALAAYDEALEHTVGVGQKLDVVLKKLRIALFRMDHKAYSAVLEVAKTMVEQGGDWDRRNRLYVYEATYLASVRDFGRSAELFVKGLSTFGATEIFSFDDFVLHMIIVAMVSLDRVELKSKVIDSPEVQAHITAIDGVAEALKSFYESDYAAFFQALGRIDQRLRGERYLAAHARYFCREMRVAAYRQMMRSYSSVKMSLMAKSFGVSEDFLDRDLSRFIATGRLFCNIDKVAGTITSTRPAEKSGAYAEVIKAGDALIHRVSRLSCVV